MAKPGARSILYRLIEAGQLARRALLAPLHERGLEAGDDAVLFLVHEQPGVAADDAAEALGLDPMSLGRRMDRLVEHGLAVRRDLGDNRMPGLLLTPRGLAACEAIEDHWRSIEGLLVDGLRRKKRKALRRTLGEFANRMR
mgnify:CR=1 FL=1